MKKILFLALAIGTMATSNAQVSNITSKPSGYQMTINAKEIGMALQYKYTIANIKNLLQAYNLPDPTIHGAALAKLDSIQNWIEELMPKVGGLHIDVIGQTHLGGSEADLTYQKMLLESQSMIKSILLANKYDLVGNEGDPYHQITKDQIFKKTLQNEMGANAKQNPQGPPLDESYYEVGGYAQNRIAVHGLLINDALSSKVVGIEDSVFYALHGLVVYNPAFKQLNELAVTIRSYIAFFKVAEYMLKTKAKNAAIVIGSLHLTDFVWIARSTGVVMDFYDTSQLEFFKTISSRIPKEGE